MPITITRTPFDGLEALQNVVQDSRSDVVQLGPGNMTGAIDHLSFDTGFGISTGSFSHAMRARGVLSETRWCLGMLLESNGPAVGHGHEFSTGDLAIAGPNEERYARFHDCTKYFAVMIAPTELQGFLDPQPGAYDFLMRHQLSVLTADPATAEANVRQMSLLLDTLDDETLPDQTASFHRRNILELLTEPFRRKARYRGAHVSWPERLVREVDRYLIAAGTRPVHISELCEHFHVHRRTLHRAFHDVLGIGPITFMRRLRLNAVHGDLLAATPGDETKVRDVAHAHGFIDLSRFADAYQRMFGEKPSHTLRRGQRIILVVLTCETFRCHWHRIDDVIG